MPASYNSYNDYLNTQRQLQCMALKRDEFTPPSPIYYAQHSHQLTSFSFQGYFFVKHNSGDYTLIHHKTNTLLTTQELSSGIKIGSPIATQLATIPRTSAAQEIKAIENHVLLYHFCYTVHARSFDRGTYGHAIDLMHRTRLDIFSLNTFFKPFTSKYDAWNAVHGVIDYPWYVLMALSSSLHTAFILPLKDKGEEEESFRLLQFITVFALLSVFFACLFLIALFFAHLTLLQNTVGLITRSASTLVATICYPEQLNDPLLADDAPSLFTPRTA